MLKPNASLAARVRALAALLVLVAVAFAPRLALAAGTVTIANRSPQENDGRWKLNMTMNMGHAPDLAHVPMIFEFTPVVLYERALEDKTGDKPILNKKRLQNQQPINESMDVGFSDGTGKIFPLTKFDFMLRRDRGYEAGEYDLVIKREGDGTQIGAKQHITLLGDNPIVDRRAIVFAGDKKKDKKKAEDKPAEGGDAKAAPEASAEPSDAPAEAATDAPAEAPAPPPVAPKQGGCGCRMAGDDVPGAPAALGLALLGAAVALRRRTRRA
jgi:MYXO-CTERM domain-containing protein